MLDQVWLWYLVVTTAAALVFGYDAPQGEVAAYTALQGGLLVAYVGMMRVTAARSAGARRLARVVYTVLAMPTVFSSLGWILPAIHPEPYEWLWVEVDRALFAADPTVVLAHGLRPWSFELLQWVYASFYFIPIVCLIGIARRRGAEAFDRAVVTIVFCFFVSYLGYFVWPTLPPYRFLPHPPLPDDVWLGAEIRQVLDDAELHRWNCFPSGHTMLSVVSLVLAWRHARGVFWGLLPVVTLLVLSTVALRYHFATDVLAGLAFVVPTMAVARWILRGA